MTCFLSNTKSTCLKRHKSIRGTVWEKEGDQHERDRGTKEDNGYGCDKNIYENVIKKHIILYN
jgi:hypothetical protein